MKRIGIITLFAALFCFMASAAMAIPVNWQTGHVYKFKYADYEWWDDANHDGNFTVGEKIYGIFQVTNIYDLNSTNPATPIWYPSSTNGQLTGNFTYTITNITEVNVTSSQYSISLQDRLDMYYNSADIFNPTWQGSWDPSLYGANAGSRWASFNVSSIPLLEPIDSSRWPVSSALNPQSLAIIQNAQMYMIYNNTGAIWYQPSLMAGTIYWCGYNATTNSAITNVGSGWEFSSNDPILATCQKPVPEPATIMLLGAGLLGLGSWGRKKTKKDKES